MLAYMDEKEKNPSYVPVYKAPGAEIVDISDDMKRK